MAMAIDFAKEEEKTLALWNEMNAFETLQALSADRPKYTFYDGPPFATGLPHYGHLLVSTINEASFATGLCKAI
jgi:isoleucyl-tRNA synthetase